MDAWQRAIVFMRTVDARTAESVVPFRVDDRPAAERLSPAFGQLGYTPERFVIMAHRRRPDHDVDTAAVQEVDWEVMRPAREREIAGQPWGADPRVVQQLLAKQELTAQGIRTRYF